MINFGSIITYNNFAYDQDIRKQMFSAPEYAGIESNNTSPRQLEPWLLSEGTDPTLYLIAASQKTIKQYSVTGLQYEATQSFEQDVIAKINEKYGDSTAAYIDDRNEKVSL